MKTSKKRTLKNDPDSRMKALVSDLARVGEIILDLPGEKQRDQRVARFRDTGLSEDKFMRLERIVFIVCALFDLTLGHLLILLTTHRKRGGYQPGGLLGGLLKTKPEILAFLADRRSREIMNLFFDRFSQGSRAGMRAWENGRVCLKLRLETDLEPMKKSRQEQDDADDTRDKLIEGARAGATMLAHWPRKRTKTIYGCIENYWKREFSQYSADECRLLQMIARAVCEHLDIPERKLAGFFSPLFPRVETAKILDFLSAHTADEILAMQKSRRQKQREDEAFLHAKPVSQSTL
jgi:hypothetical protein